MDAGVGRRRPISELGAGSASELIGKVSPSFEFVMASDPAELAFVVYLNVIDRVI